MAAIDVPGFIADLKDHAVTHGFHVHDERHFVETYSLRQAWEVDLHPEDGCGGPVDLHMELDVDPRMLLAFEDAVVRTPVVHRLSLRATGTPASGPLTMIMLPQGCVVACVPCRLYFSVAAARSAASTTGKYSGRAPAITALTATFSTVNSHGRRNWFERRWPTTSSGLWLLPLLLLLSLTGAALVFGTTARAWVGAVPQAHALAWKQWPGMTTNPNFDDAIREAASGHKVVLLCRSGVRSVAAAQRATQLGLEAYNILEGFEGDPDANAHRGLLGGWRKRGLPWRQN
mgnify:CR=1 FL=1